MVLFDHIARFWPRLVAGAAVVSLAVAVAVAARVARHAQDPGAFMVAFERETGLRLDGVGKLEPVLLPSPGLLARNVSVRPGGVVRQAEIEALTAHLDLSQLLVGRLRVAAVTLASANLRVDPAHPVSSRLRAAAARERRRLDTLRLRDVTLVFDGAGAPAPVRVVTGELHWRDADAPAAFSGALIWRGVSADVAVWAEQPVDLWNGRPSVLLARLRSAPLSVEAQGEYAEGLGFRGHIDARAANLRTLADLGLFDAPQLRSVGAVAVKAEAALTNRGLSFANASVRLDDNAFEGSFSLRYDEGRPSLAATLASPDLDVSAWLGAAPRLLETDPNGHPAWSQTPIDLTSEAAADLDLRISASRLRLPPYEASDVALAVLMRRGRTELTVSEARGYGGAARARLRVAPLADGVEARGLISLADIDLGQTPEPPSGKRLLRGVLSGQLSFEAKGATPRALAAALDGRLTARLEKGEIGGLDLEHLVLRPSRRLPVIVSPDAARTTLDSAALHLRSVSGAVIVDDARLKGPAVEAVARGGLDLAALSGSVRLETRAVGEATTAPRPVFYLGGSLFDLQTLPDPLGPSRADPPPAASLPPFAR